MNAPDLRGLVFGHLLVTGFAKEGKRGAYWYCDCTCGAKRVITGRDLLNGNSSSCGHTRGHGGTIDGKRIPEYLAWQNMISRCERKSSNSYKNYGARGIKVCDRWRRGIPGATGFECFLKDVGKRPAKGFSLDRTDNNKDYQPGNCKWSSRKEQAENRRTSRWITVDGKRMVFEDAIKILKVKQTMFYRLLSEGVSRIEALKKTARVKVETLMLS